MHLPRLLIGIGNSARSDDGLGWAFLEEVENRGLFAGQVEYRYQLQVEDAALVSKAGRVVFVDACRDELNDGYHWVECEPSKVFEFTSHVLPPAAVLQLCKDLYGRVPAAKLLLIQGEDWGLDIGLSPCARRNLEKALRSFADLE